MKTPKKPGHDWIGFSVFLFVWGGVTIPIDAWLSWGIVKQWKTASYLETVGTITHSSVEIDHDDEGASYSAKIQYRYEVDRQQYSGHRYKYSSQSWGKRSARRTVKAFPVGDVVPVYYRPTRPQESVLRRGFDARDFLSPFFMVPFNTVMLLMIYGLLKWKFRYVFRSDNHWLRNFPIRDDGLTVRLKVSMQDPIPAALVALMGIGFLQIFVIFFLLEDRWNWPLCVLFLGIDLAAMLLGGIWANRWNKSDRYDLTVDRTSEKLLLPRQPDRKQGPAIPFDAIDVIDQTVQIAKSDEDRDDHRLTIRYREGDETKSAVVASNHNRTAFFHFSDDEEDLSALKDWIMRETGWQESSLTEQQE